MLGTLARCMLSPRHSRSAYILCKKMPRCSVKPNARQGLFMPTNTGKPKHSKTYAKPQGGREQPPA